MPFRKIQDADIKGKNILVRVDFNVKLERDDIREKYKMFAARDTILFLQKNGARTISLLTHLGRPEGKRDESVSLFKITDDIERVLGIQTVFLNDCIGEAVEAAVENAEGGEVFLLENVRFHAGEEENDEAFAEALAKPFDVFVNDAFSVCHRAHASIVSVTKHLPSYPGIYLEKEVDALSIVRSDVESPSTAIVGGAKIMTKLPLIEEFSKHFDTILVGGKIANEAMDEDIPLPENVILPEDFEGDRLDIGERTRKLFLEKLEGRKTIVWNGPMGVFEDKRYAKGTVEIAKAVAASEAFSIVGGGESVEALEELSLIDKVGFVSTGGGAMLAFLTGENMPGLEALEKE